jgi:hypothetical protein
MTCAQITTIPMNKVSEANAAASSMSERIIIPSPRTHKNEEGT